MTELASLFPVSPSHPAYEILRERAQRTAEQDIALRLWAKEIDQKWPLFLHTRIKGGSELPISEILRNYFFEFATRIIEGGPRSFPTSFNVVESFLVFSHEFFVFDIRKEHEHLLSLSDYLDWYTAGRFPEDPGILKDLLMEGEIYAYNMAGAFQDFMIGTGESDLALLGVAFVRHNTELSAMAVVGESPPYKTDEEASRERSGREFAPRGKEHIRPNPRLSVKDRYLREAPNRCRVLALARFDLGCRRYSVRYVNVDLGSSFRILTDDPGIFPRDMDRSKREALTASLQQRLVRYDPLFAAMASLMYLPAFFISENDRVKTAKFSTQLHQTRASSKVKKAVRSLGRSEVCFFREVKCFLTENRPPAAATQVVDPPRMDFQQSGFWKPLPPGQIGEDEAGNAVVGRTWVERLDSWSSHSLEAFVVERSSPQIGGPDPGWVYVVKSGSHGIDLYKIGITRRAPEERARELSGTTGVATPFEVLATFHSCNVSETEREIHRRLGRFRVNRRREFFRAPLPVIISTATEVVSEVNSNMT